MTLTTPPPRFPVVPSNRRIHHMQRGQRGVTLFFALIALVSIMLAAVALVRSVDTSTIIAGNLAFQQAATRSTDTGAEAAMVWLKTQADSTTDNPTTTAAHPFNNDSPANGYYASLDTAQILTGTNTLTWKTLTMDSSGNTTLYVIQRMCRTSGVAAKDAACLYSGAAVDTSGQNIKLPQDVCVGGGCPAAGQSAQMRITARTVGPRNTLSYAQTFIY